MEEAWLDQFFAAYYRRHPVNATFIGVHHLDHLLPDASPDYPSPLPHDMPGEVRGTDLLLAEGQIAIERWEEGSNHFRLGNPCYYTGEAIFGVLSLFLRGFAPLPQRVTAATARMEAIPAFLRRAQDTVRRAPGWWIQRAIDECGGALAFFRAGTEILRAEAGIESAAWREAADREERED